METSQALVGQQADAALLLLRQHLLHQLNTGLSQEEEGRSENERPVAAPTTPLRG